MSVPAIGLVGHDHDSCQADGEEVGDNDEDVIETRPSLLHSGCHPDNDRERDQDNEYDVDDEQLIASSLRILVVWRRPCCVDLERYISHLVALFRGRAAALVEVDSTAGS